MENRKANGLIVPHWQQANEVLLSFSLFVNEANGAGDGSKVWSLKKMCICGPGLLSS